MVRVTQVGEQPRVNAGVQRLHPPVEALGETGYLLYSRHRYARRLDRRSGRAGRHQLDAGLREALRELGQTGLVVDAEQCAPNRPLCVAHGMLTFLPDTVQPSRTIRPMYSTSCARSTSLIRSARESSVSSSSTGTATCAMIGPVST